MAEPIDDVGYWKARLKAAQDRGMLHESIFRCPLQRWEQIEHRHCHILTNVLSPDTSILDVGCGYGRLLTMLPDWWQGRYLGIDISPDFIAMAKENHPSRLFLCADAREPHLRETLFGEFDLAVLISIRPMVKRNLGEDAWNEMEMSVKMMAEKVLYLEYDPEDMGAWNRKA